MTMEIRMPERVEDVTPQPDQPHEPADSLTYEPAAPAGPAEPAAAQPEQPTLPGAEADAPPKREPKSLTIGAVCKSLEREFPDISISKIRYLEDQKLLAPRRTRGGYRLYSPGDVDRLRTILRLQRDEFLPLRVIRQELAAGRADAGEMASGGTRTQPGIGTDPRALRRATLTVKREGAPLYRLADVLEETGAAASLVKELEDYGVIKGERRDGEQFYDDTEREIIRAVAELARFGVGGRNLRVFRTSADREAALLEQILAPALRSRNPERRREAVDQLENLAAVASHLKYLLLVRDLRKITS
jgi:DNA-binding transcriptional MerR regulator